MNKKMKEAIKICKKNKYDYRDYDEFLFVDVPKAWQDKTNKEWMVPEKIFAMADRVKIFKDLKNREDKCKTTLMFGFDVREKRK